MQMNHRLSTFFTATIISLTNAAISQAQNVDPAFETIKVTDGIYMLTGASGFTGGNIGISIGEDGVVVIDDGMPNVLDKLRSEIAKLTDQPVDYLINTHVHGDHIGNNAAFGQDGTRIISHENLRATLLSKGIQGPDGMVETPKSALPVITFSDHLTLNLNGDEARITHLKNAHTDADAIIYFQKANVIHAGDIMFNRRFPYIDTDNGGSLNGMIDGLRQIALIGDARTRIIPGHGPLADKADLENAIAMLEDAKIMVREFVAAGKTNAQILSANPLIKYEDYSWGFITTEKMTTQVISAIRNGAQ